MKAPRRDTSGSGVVGTGRGHEAKAESQHGRRSEEPVESRLAEDLVNSLNRLFGRQTTNRAVHAKGVLLQGTFLPGPEAPRLSRAAHFQDATPITIRFSNSPGIATIPDADPMANPRGMALKFHMPDGSETDVVAHSFNGFPVATAEEFLQLMVALGASGPGTAKPTPADLFLAAHPVAKAFLESQAPPPVSYANLAYFGVNSFLFTNAEGRSRFGRYRIEPHAGIQYLTGAQATTAAPNYLAAEIAQRLAKSRIGFDFRVQLAGAGDAIDDPSIAWPDTREFVRLGIIEIKVVVQDSAEAERQLIFSPATLTDGIDPADPMIQARSDAYSVSYDRRHA
jgi:catalase